MKIKANIFAIKIVLVLPGLLLFNVICSGQFYNGLHMNFGKSRIQYQDEVWQYYRSKRVDVYFYVGGSELAKITDKIATKKLGEVETLFGYTLDKRLIFIVYNKLSDFRQSNVGLVSGSEQYNIGGVTKIVGNKVFIYYEGNRKKLEQQISAAIAEMLLSEMVYGTNFRQKLTNSTLLSLPDWYYDGLVSYISNSWDVEIDNRVRDGILSGKFEKFNRLTGIEAKYAGHSIWNYVANTYGKSVIPNIVFLTRVSKTIDNGFSFVLGMPLKYLTNDWLAYYKKVYESEKFTATVDQTEVLPVKIRKDRLYDQFKVSPDGSKAAWATNEMGKYKIFVYNDSIGKKEKIFRKEHKLEQITDYSYPILTWHPTGKVLAFVVEKQAVVNLYFYFLDEKKLNSRELHKFEKILDFSYSDNGMKLVLSAVQEGQTDVFVYNIASNTIERITDDPADDLHPRFISNSSQIIFCSNRDGTKVNDQKNAEVLETSDIFIYDYENESDDMKKIISTPFINEFEVFEFSTHKYTYLSDESGIINQYVAKYDSVISYIDTAAHYRYYAKSYPLTDYSRSILSLDIDKNHAKSGQIILQDSKYNLVFRNFEMSEPNANYKHSPTSFRKQMVTRMLVSDSLVEQKKADPPKHEPEIMDTVYKIAEDTTVLDLNNYVFEKEREWRNQRQDNEPVPEKSAQKETGNDADYYKPRVYFTSFYTDYIVNQVDFGFLNASYQAYTGSAVYFNPGFNVLLKVGTKDLFEDYKVTGAYRISGNLESNEYLISVENLKKRLDKQVVFHRQAFSASNYDEQVISKNYTHELLYIANYPFSQITSVKATATLRNDKTVILARDNNSLSLPDKNKSWVGLKLEFIMDNTINKGVNLYNGTRLKIFAEGYEQLDKKDSDLGVIGLDFRHYQKIHRDLIWANRIAASSAFGRSKLIYYLGGTDNWVNLSGKTPTFNPIDEVPINQEEEYAFQALATNMRGFSQNIRNGTSFAVFNSELRWPVIKYLANRPINSDFLTNFQVVGFFDLGSAWSGKSPDDKKNAYNTQIRSSNSITVIVDRERSPFVYGYGVGLRSRLLGYFVRVDWAWGVENNVVLPRIFYLSLSLDF